MCIRDRYINGSMYKEFDWNENVHVFGEKVELIENEDCDIYGFGFGDFYRRDSKVDEINIKNKEKINILITHGTLNGGDVYKRQNLDSMKAAIDYLGKINAKNKIAVLGDMLELGEFSKELHERVGEEVQKNKIDILITVGDLSLIHI